MAKNDRLEYVKSHWKRSEPYRFSRFAIQNFLQRPTLVPDVSEDFETPSKKFLATSLQGFINKIIYLLNRYFFTRTNCPNSIIYKLLVFIKNDTNVLKDFFINVQFYSWSFITRLVYTILLAKMTQILSRFQNTYPCLCEMPWLVLNLFWSVFSKIM